MADLQGVQASDGVPSPAETDSSAFSPPADDTIPPPEAAAAVAQDTNTPPPETSHSNQHFCAYAICVNHNYNNDPSTSAPFTPSSSPPTPQSKPCPKCHTTTYCSRPCQKADWKSHKRSCAANAQLRSKTDIGTQRGGGRSRVPARDQGQGQGQRLRKWQFDT